MRETKLPSSELTDAVRQALIDISARAEAGLPLNGAINTEPDRELGSTEQAKIFQTKEGKILIQWDTVDTPGESVQMTATSFPSNEQRDRGEEEIRDLEAATLEPTSAIELEKSAEVQPQNSVTPLNKGMSES